MKLLTKEIRQRLIRNGETGAGTDTAPAVKLFTPDANATWLLPELEPRDTSRAFGLSDLGLGFPELSYVDLGEIARLRGPRGLPVERGRHFAPDKTLAEYAEEARTAFASELERTAPGLVVETGPDASLQPRLQ